VRFRRRDDWVSDCKVVGEYVDPHGSRFRILYDPWEGRCIIESYFYNWRRRGWRLEGRITVLFREEADFLIEALRKIRENLVYGSDLKISK